MIAMVQTSNPPVILTKAVRKRSGGWWLLLKCPSCGVSLALQVRRTARARWVRIEDWSGREVRCKCGCVATLNVHTDEGKTL